MYDKAMAVDADYDRAMAAAMKKLNRRAYVRYQLQQKLERLGFAGDVIRRVAERLVEVGVLDDVAFGRALIREAKRSKPAGPRLLRQKLMQRDLDCTLIERLLEEENRVSDQVTDAGRLVELKLRSTRLADDKPTLKRKLWAMLARRGYETDTIERVLAKHT